MLCCVVLCCVVLCCAVLCCLFIRSSLCYLLSRYRLLLAVDVPSRLGSRLRLHFGAVDWQCVVYVNGRRMGAHTGGYDAFSVDITTEGAPEIELLVYVHDPSDAGPQPNGKQRASAVDKPGGDTYTPVSGIWQTVWLEVLPDVHIARLMIDADTERVTVTPILGGAAVAPMVSVEVFDGGRRVASGAVSANESVVLRPSEPKLWSPERPHLYDIVASIAGGDAVLSYFGMRTFRLSTGGAAPAAATGPQAGSLRHGPDLPGTPLALPRAAPGLCWAQCNGTRGCAAWVYSAVDPQSPRCWLKSAVTGFEADACCVSGVQAGTSERSARPLLNGRPQFLAGWLDQSWWPDGYGM